MTAGVSLSQGLSDLASKDNRVYRLAVDIGGTFTDAVLVNDTDRRIWATKALTTAEPAVGALQAAERVVTAAGVRFVDIDMIVHATTLVPNAILQRRGARIGLLTNTGFTDIAHMGREVKYDTLNLMAPLVEPLVDRGFCEGIGGRILADGTELRPFDLVGLRDVLSKWRGAQLGAIAVCFLHSYRNSAHEKQAEAVIAEAFGADFPVSISSEVAPAFREYERVSTTLVNAYTQPVIGRYLALFEGELRARGYGGRLYVMLSGGGIATTEVSARFPSRMVESGPAAGVLAAARFGQALGLKSVVAFDVGGTTAKACLVRDGAPSRSTSSEVARTERFMKGSGLPVQLPSVDLVEVGAGGGSIAHLDALGLLHVGPRSAESNPGPACYGFGGEEPTVTDANLLLGYLDPETFAGGTMRLDLGKARQAMDRVGGVLGLPAEDCALAVYELISETMADAIRVHLAEHGEDPRRTVLLASGGGGPLHAGLVARKLGISRIIIPGRAGVLSAVGLLAAPPAFDVMRSYPVRLEASTDWRGIENLLTGMEKQAVGFMRGAGVPNERITLSRTADMRWVGQTHTVTAGVPDDVTAPGALRALKASFDAEFARIYGARMEQTTLETLTWRVSASGPAPEIGLSLDRPTGTPLKGTRQLRFRGIGQLTGSVYDRYALPAGFKAEGPAVVEERESTALIAPGEAFEVDGIGNLVISAATADEARA